MSVLASELRQRYPGWQHRRNSETHEVHRTLESPEKYVDGTVASLIRGFPARRSLSEVKGIDRKDFAEVLTGMGNSELRACVQFALYVWRDSGLRRWMK